MIPESTAQQSMKTVFRVRDIEIQGRLILSPMAGFSDLPYRSMCRALGSAMSYTEFVSAAALVQKKNEKVRQKLSYREDERPIVFQIFDSDENRIVEAARQIEQLGPDIIDLNMGCSVSQVSGRGAGAGLLKDPVKIGRIFDRLSNAVRVPVTGKIRLGWDPKSLNYREVVRAMEENGAALVAVHGRTKSQAYRGSADWDSIADIVQRAGIPVVGNGDVRTRDDIQRIFEHTGCAGVMIGRGAIGHPWIFQYKNREEVSFAEKAEFIAEHFRRMLVYYGESLACILVRKHVARYLKGYPRVRDLQQQFVRVESAELFFELLRVAEDHIGAEGCPVPLYPQSLVGVAS